MFEKLHVRVHVLWRLCGSNLDLCQSLLNVLPLIMQRIDATQRLAGQGLTLLLWLEEGPYLPSLNRQGQAICEGVN